MAKIVNSVITFDLIKAITTLQKLQEFEAFRYSEYEAGRFNSYEDLMDPDYFQGSPTYNLNYDRPYTPEQQAVVLKACQDLETRWKNAYPA